MRPAACLFGVFLLLCSALAAATPGVKTEDLSALLDRYAERRGFNGTVLVAREGRILLHAAYGNANMEWGVPNRTDGRFRIGSLSKPLVATLTLQLVQDGRLRLDGTLADYLPELYANTPSAPVTVAQLLSHTSGIGDLPARFTDPWWQTEARHRHAPMAFARAWIPPVQREPPGQQWRYNNNGFFLLGLLIEQVTGQSLAHNLQTRIFVPAGMTASGLYADDAVLDHLAQGYTRSPDGSVAQAPWIHPSVSYAAAGIHSSTEDLFRFDQALYSERLLRADMRALMLQVHAGSYGFGWNVEQWTLPDGRQLPVSSHTGSVPGYQSYYLRSEPHRDTVIILDNLWQGALVVAMGRDLMEVLNGKPIQPVLRSLDDLLTPILYRQGPDAMVQAWERLGSQAADYDRSERALNSFGYSLLRRDMKDAAVRVFEWAVAAYPDSANTHDSLGEAYRASGRVPDARRSYQAALARDPGSASALSALAAMADVTPLP